MGSVTCVDRAPKGMSSSSLEKPVGCVKDNRFDLKRRQLDKLNTDKRRMRTFGIVGL